MVLTSFFFFFDPRNIDGWMRLGTRDLMWQNGQARFEIPVYTLPLENSLTFFFAVNSYSMYI